MYKSIRFLAASVIVLCSTSVMAVPLNCPTQVMNAAGDQSKWNCQASASESPLKWKAKNLANPCNQWVPLTSMPIATLAGTYYDSSDVTTPGGPQASCKYSANGGSATKFFASGPVCGVGMTTGCIKNPGAGSGAGGTSGGSGVIPAYECTSGSACSPLVVMP